jgi:hypothetical protein
MTDRANNTQTDDNSQGADRGGANVKISLVGFDKPLLTASALALSIVAVLFCFFTWSWEERRAYFTQRCESFIEQIAFEGYDRAYTRAPLEIKTDCVVVINRGDIDNERNDDGRRTSGRDRVEAPNQREGNHNRPR